MEITTEQITDAIQARKRRHLYENLNRTFIYAILMFFTVQTVYPIIWMTFSALKTQQDLFDNIWGPPRQLIWQNFFDAWEVGSLGARIGNSIFVTVSSVALLTVLATLGAYALAPY